MIVLLLMQRNVLEVLSSRASWLRYSTQRYRVGEDDGDEVGAATERVAG